MFLYLVLLCKLSGSKSIGQPFTHRPQRIHEVAFGGLAVSLSKASNAFVCLTTVFSRENCAIPIIGPPINIFSGLDLNPPQNSKTS